MTGSFKDRGVETDPVLLTTITGMLGLEASERVTTGETITGGAPENKPDYVPEGSIASTGRRNDTESG